MISEINQTYKLTCLSKAKYKEVSKEWKEENKEVDLLQIGGGERD